MVGARDAGMELVFFEPGGSEVVACVSSRLASPPLAVQGVGISQRTPSNEQISLINMTKRTNSKVLLVYFLFEPWCARIIAHI